MVDNLAPSPADLYKLAIEEYHFQVNLNWSRTQYFLGLNVAIIGAGTGIMKLGTSGTAEGLTGCVFLVGLTVAVLSVFVTARQHSYYRTARDRMKAIEQTLALPQAHVVQTTGGLQGAPRTGLRRRVTVTNVTYLVLVVLAIVDGVGFIYAVTR